MNIIDPHCHLWDLSLNKHSWLISDIEVRHLGDYAPIRKSYLLKDILNESKKYHIEKLVYIQCGWERADAEGEVRWVQQVLDQANQPGGIIGYADLSQENSAKTLEGFLKYPNFRGIRQIINYDPDPYYQGCSIDYLNMPAWRKNFSALNQHGLCFDLQIFPEQVDSVLEIVKQNPNVRFLINHAIMPKKHDLDYQRFWKAQLIKLAPLENVFIKISGFGMFEPNWTAASIRPFVETAIEAFGVRRAMFASNFPVDKLYRSWDEMYDAYASIVKEYNEQEKAQLFYQNAERIYQI